MKYVFSSCNTSVEKNGVRVSRISLHASKQNAFRNKKTRDWSPLERQMRDRAELNESISFIARFTVYDRRCTKSEKRKHRCREVGENLVVFVYYHLSVQDGTSELFPDSPWLIISTRKQFPISRIYLYVCVEGRVVRIAVWFYAYSSTDHSISYFNIYSVHKKYY